MYPNLFQALGESRIRDWHEQAARDRLIKQARRARREAASAARLPRLPRLRPGSRRPAPVSPAPADEQAAVAADRQPAGSRAA
jgi:hypothetical protein